MKQKIFNLIVLDASGSMYSIRNEAVAGVVETIQTIRTAQDENANQEHLLSLVVFNGKRINTVFDRMPITKVPDFSKKDYLTTDNTPLYDAMGNAITNLQRYIDKDDNVLVTIITDGYENASVESSASLSTCRGLEEKELALHLYRRQPGCAGSSQEHGH